MSKVAKHQIEQPRNGRPTRVAKSQWKFSAAAEAIRRPPRQKYGEGIAAKLNKLKRQRIQQPVNDGGPVLLEQGGGGGGDNDDGASIEPMIVDAPSPVLVVAPMQSIAPSNSPKNNDSSPVERISNPTQSISLTKGDLLVELHSVNTGAAFKCPGCGWGLETESDLVQHIENAHPFLASCGLCPKGGESNVSLADHVRDIHFHEVKNCRYCGICGEICNSQNSSDLLQHFLYSCPRVQKCMLCHRTPRHSIKYHRDRVHPDIMHSYGCSQCFEFFPSIDFFVDHVCKERVVCRCDPTVSYDSINELFRRHLSRNDGNLHHYLEPLLQEPNQRRRFFIYNPSIWQNTEFVAQKPKIPRIPPQPSSKTHRVPASAHDKEFVFKGPWETECVIPAACRPSWSEILSSGLQLKHKIIRSKNPFPELLKYVHLTTCPEPVMIDRFPVYPVRQESAGISESGASSSGESHLSPSGRIVNDENRATVHIDPKAIAQAVQPQGEFTQRCPCTKERFSADGLMKHNEQCHFANDLYLSPLIPMDALVTVCPHCLIAFERPAQLRHHMLIHSAQNKDFDNFLCDSMCCSNYSISQVQSTLHKGYVSWFCLRCAKGFNTETEFYLHCRDSHGLKLLYFCSNCFCGSSDVARILPHIEKCTETDYREKIPAKLCVVSMAMLWYRPICLERFLKAYAYYKFPVVKRSVCATRPPTLKMDKHYVLCKSCDTVHPMTDQDWKVVNNQRTWAIPVDPAVINGGGSSAAASAHKPDEFMKDIEPQKLQTLHRSVK